MKLEALSPGKFLKKWSQEFRQCPDKIHDGHVNIRKSGLVRVAAVAFGLAAVIAIPVMAQTANASDAPRISVSNARVYPDASDATWRKLRVRVVSSTLPVEVRLIRNGTAVQTKTVARSGASVSFSTANLRTGTYSVVASDGQDETATRVTVSRGWSPISADRPSWAACSTITWSYDASRAPRGGDAAIRKDARAAFATLAAATGLTFKPVRSSGDIVVRWGAAGGADGLGGVSWTNGPGSAVSGYVELNRTSEWARTPGTNNRGVLLLHEATHALGLGHVNLDKALMSPTYLPGTTSPTIGTGERRGLSTVYRPGKC